MQIETRLLEREGKALTNFAHRLPAPNTDLAHQSLKDPYLFDFLRMGKEADERAIESVLVQHITQFLLELGAEFAFVGRQVHLEVGSDDFFIDLGLYLTAVDRQIKTGQNNSTIGLLLCKSKNKVVAEYALSDKTQPVGIAEYKLLEALPAELQTGLPSIEQIENELAALDDANEDGSN